MDTPCSLKQKHTTKGLLNSSQRHFEAFIQIQSTNDQKRIQSGWLLGYYDVFPNIDNIQIA